MGSLRNPEDSEIKLPKNTTTFNQLRRESAETTRLPTEPPPGYPNPKVSCTRAIKTWWIVLKYFKKLYRNHSHTHNGPPKTSKTANLVCAGM